MADQPDTRGPDNPTAPLADVWASLNKAQRDGMEMVAWALEYFDACMTGRQFRRATARSLVALGLLEEKWAYQVDEHDSLTDRYRMGYRFTPLGQKVDAARKSEAA